MKSSTLTLILVLLATFAPQLATAETIERRVAAMGTELSIVVEAGTREDALGAAEFALGALRAAEARLSTWRPESELSRFNNAPEGVAQLVSPRLASDLADALRCGRETAGAFSPGLGLLVRAWGLRSGGRLPRDSEIDALLPALAFDNLVVEENVATRMDRRFVIEEGAFGKGVGLEDAIDALSATAATAAVFDFGGHVAVWGAARVSVGLTDPWDRERVVLRVDLPSGSLATTGNSERGLVVGGVRLGHVLDPATGRPVADFGSVSVWAGSATQADCLSTALYVMGPERALEWAATRPEIGVIVLDRDERGLRTRATGNLSLTSESTSPTRGTEEK
jgi:thiamine biosynthesis lipoprotein